MENPESCLNHKNISEKRYKKLKQTQTETETEKEKESERKRERRAEKFEQCNAMLHKTQIFTIN